MNLKEYSAFAPTTAIFPKDVALVYLTLGLTNEAGEVAGKIKKIIRDGNQSTMDVLSGVIDDQSAKEKLSAELGDVFWYLVNLCVLVDLDPEQILQDNHDKLKSRQERNALGGSGDNR